ncbi:MAG: aspartate aminotransferase family protein [bacterium]
MSDWTDEEKFLIPTYDRIPVEFGRGEGPYLYDKNNNRYIDALAGIAVNILGYRHPRLVEAVRDQADKIPHVSNLFHISPQLELAKKLSNIGFESSAFFCNSGAEANEAALKFARKYSERSGSGGKKVLSFNNSFHGRTMGALAATGQKKYRDGFGPLPGEFEYIDYNDPEQLKENIDESTCGLIMELVQGEGGVLPAGKDFVREVRKVCSENDVLLIVDEIQTGMGRTGSFFCYQQYGIEPDLVTLAKGLGGGYPIGALLVRREIREGLQSSEHASTFGGNPFVCSLACQVLDSIAEEKLVENARQRGKQLEEGLAELARTSEKVNPPRGRGLMLALPLDSSCSAAEVMNKARGNGLIVGVAGGNSLRYVPPLILSAENIEEIIEKTRKTVESL